MTKTALLLIDPYNDFLHPRGKLYPRLAESLSDSNTTAHLHEALKAARAAGIIVFYCMHQRTNASAFKGWGYLSESQRSVRDEMVFEEGSFGAGVFEGLEPDREGDVVVGRHWGSSSFANTDLDLQLRKHGVSKLVFAGLVANTCIESTARYAYELGYEITMLTDATAGFSTDMKDAATRLIWPLFANRVCTTAEWAEGLEGFRGE